MHRKVSQVCSLCVILICHWPCFLGNAVGQEDSHSEGSALAAKTREVSAVLVVLGNAQDGGYPQANCKKACCAAVWDNLQSRSFVSCVALLDCTSGERFLLDCTPDFPEQLHLLDRIERQQGWQRADWADRPWIAGVLPTHAHVGHYAGLIHLGREVMGAKSVPLYAMPRMKYFLETNGPWSQLVSLQQIDIRRCAARQPVRLTDQIEVTPFLVPHRDEFSETVGYRVSGPTYSIAYLPDIDKWERWEVEVEELIKSVDIALLDGTFFDAKELPGRNMSEIPHPFVAESIDRFSRLPIEERKKVHFIHLNHTNPLLRNGSEANQTLEAEGMNVATQGSWFPL